VCLNDAGVVEPLRQFFPGPAEHLSATFAPVDGRNIQLLRRPTPSGNLLRQPPPVITGCQFMRLRPNARYDSVGRTFPLGNGEFTSPWGTPPSERCTGFGWLGLEPFHGGIDLAIQATISSRQDTCCSYSSTTMPSHSTRSGALHDSLGLLAALGIAGRQWWRTKSKT